MHLLNALVTVNTLYIIVKLPSFFVVVFQNTPMYLYILREFFRPVFVSFTRVSPWQ